MAGRPKPYVDDGSKGINLPHAMTVTELIWRLDYCPPDAVVTLGTAPGPLSKVTETVNGYVILDCADPEGGT
jgi:hypothetical protein